MRADSRVRCPEFSDDGMAGVTVAAPRPPTPGGLCDTLDRPVRPLLLGTRVRDVAAEESGRQMPADGAGRDAEATRARSDNAASSVILSDRLLTHVVVAALTRSPVPGASETQSEGRSNF